MRYQKVLILPVVVLIGSFVSIAQEVPKAPAALSGNWHLSGSLGFPVDGPRLIVSLIVEGDRDFTHLPSGKTLSSGLKSEMAGYNNYNELPRLPTAKRYKTTFQSTPIARQNWHNCQC